MAQVPATAYESIASGSVSEFTIPFPFLTREEVFVSVNGAPVEFTWVNDGLVQLAATPGVGAKVRRYRSTLAFTPKHVFSTGVPFLPRNVDEDFKQNLYAVQEAVNETAGTAAEALAAAQAALDLVEARARYVNLGVYGPGLVFETTSQVCSYDAGSGAEFYAPGPNLPLPYTTTGNPAELVNFRSVGDAVLRQDLEATDGATLVGRGSGTIETALSTLEVAATQRVLRLATKAAAVTSTIAGSAVIEGEAVAGDGAWNLVVLDADDTTSPNDGVRAIESTGGTLRSMLHMQGAEIPLPAGFGYAPLVKIIKTAKGYAADKDVRSLMPAITGVTYYVDYITGNDANAGTAIAPLKGIKAALAKPDVGRVKVAPAFYPHNYNWASSFPAGVNFAVERWEGVRPGPVINSTADDALTWTVNGTYANVWQATRSIVAKVRDYSRRAADGRYFEYRSVASLLLCSQTSGTYYYDGSIVYVNTLENAKPHPQIKVFLETAAAYFNTPFAVLVDGIEFHGGREAFYPTNNSAAGGLLIANDCKFLYAQNATVGNGVRLEGVADSYFQNCEASYNNRDGFNYHVSTTVIPKVTEINCRGFYNGQDGAGVNNGSTMHDAGRIVRIGGEFAYSEGPQVVDVGDSKSFNAGVHAYASRLGLDTIANANFYLSGGEMWLLDCDAEYSLYDVAITSGGIVHLCRTPVRTSNAALNYYVQPSGAVLT